MWAGNDLHGTGCPGAMDDTEGTTMGLEIMETRQTENGVAVTFVTERGQIVLEGSEAQIARLAEVMAQVAALAALNETENVWIESVAVGDSLVRLGLRPGGEGRVQIINPAKPAR
jgi:hypothetical protein